MRTYAHRQAPQHPPHVGVRDRVIVQVEADIGVLPTEAPSVRAAARIIGQRQQAARFVGEHRQRCAAARRAAAVGGEPLHQASAWALRSSTSVKARAAKKESGRRDGALDAALLVAAGDRDRASS